MLPASQRLRSSAEFGIVMRSAKKKGSSTVVVYFYRPSYSVDNPAVDGGPKMGLVISKAVGNSVVRHRVARKLRAATSQIFDSLLEEKVLERRDRIVLRALPAAAQASTADCRRDIDQALEKIMRSVRSNSEYSEGW